MSASGNLRMGQDERITAAEMSAIAAVAADEAEAREIASLTAECEQLRAVLEQIEMHVNDALKKADIYGATTACMVIQTLLRRASTRSRL